MNLKMNPIGLCYVILDLEQNHFIAQFKNNFIYYPERDMTLIETIEYNPFEKSIVTENPWIISTYPAERVRIWDKRSGWKEPNMQTFGASLNKITMSLLGVRQTIPSAVLGSKEINELIEKTTMIYSKSIELLDKKALEIILVDAN